MYNNDPKTMGNKIQTREKIEPQHIYKQKVASDFAQP